MSCSTQVREAALALCSAERPLLLLGPEGGPAKRHLLALAERLGAAILTTPDALSLVDAERTCGTFSFGACAGARKAMERADVVLAASALGEFTCRLGEALCGHTLIQLTERASDVGRSTRPCVALVGALCETAASLGKELEALLPLPRAPWWTGRAEACPSLPGPPGYIHPIGAIAAIQAALPEPCRVCIDVTTGALHAYEHLRLHSSQRAFSSIENSGCMGEAFMASLGIRLASQLPTLAIVGDWGYSMAPAELHTAVELGLDRYVVLVWANAGGAFIGAGVKQQKLRVPEAAWRFRRPPELANAAQAYGAEGVLVTDAQALERELTRAFRGQGPVVIEAHIDPEVAVPAGDRFLTLGDSA